MPKIQTCSTCRWWEKDRGIFTATGWTGAGYNRGYCHAEPKAINKEGSDGCRFWEEREDDK